MIFTLFALWTFTAQSETLLASASDELEPFHLLPAFVPISFSLPEHHAGQFPQPGYENTDWQQLREQAERFEGLKLPTCILGYKKKVNINKENFPFAEFKLFLPLNVYLVRVGSEVVHVDAAGCVKVTQSWTLSLWIVVWRWNWSSRTHLTRLSYLQTGIKEEANKLSISCFLSFFPSIGSTFLWLSKDAQKMQQSNNISRYKFVM